MAIHTNGMAVGGTRLLLLLINPNLVSLQLRIFFFTVRLGRLLALLSRPLLFLASLPSVCCKMGSSLNISGASSLAAVAAVATGPLRPGCEESETH